MNSNSKQLDITISCFNTENILPRPWREAVSISIRIGTKRQIHGDSLEMSKEKTKIDGCFTPKPVAKKKDGDQSPETKIEIQVTEDSEEYQALLRRLNYPA